MHNTVTVTSIIRLIHECDPDGHNEAANRPDKVTDASYMQIIMAFQLEFKGKLVNFNMYVFQTVSIKDYRLKTNGFHVSSLF